MFAIVESFDILMWSVRRGRPLEGEQTSFGNTGTYVHDPMACIPRPSPCSNEIRNKLQVAANVFGIRKLHRLTLRSTLLQSVNVIGFANLHSINYRPEGTILLDI